MKKTKRRLFSALLTCLMLLLFPMAARADSPAQYSAGTLDELISAVMEINRNGGEAEITLTNNITLSRAAWQAAHTAAGRPH